ncbi:MAG: amidohydrolase [Planctomycetota bacterium]|nr:MAG: amidohydrolase [Planctomycetota bacterium]
MKYPSGLGRNRLSRAVHACVPLFAFSGLPESAEADVLAIKGETIHTMAGNAIENGVVVIEDAKIKSVGPAADVPVPPGARVLSARVVTPGLIDAHCVIGFTGYLNQDQDQDQLDPNESIQPELRAIDGYNPQEKLVEYVRGYGITTIHTGHAPGALISGQTMIVKTTGNNVDEAILEPVAMIAATLGEGAKPHGDPKKSPGTRSKAVAMLRSELVKAQNYLKKLDSDDEKKKPDRDLRMEAISQLLKRELPLLVTAHRATDILAALRLAREFNLRLVLDGCAEGYLVQDEIKAMNIPVILHPTMWRSGRGETENISFETASLLTKDLILVALQSGYESYVPKTRVVLFEAGIAAANGLGFNEALSTITINAARILDIDDRVGSIEPGKDADLALYDGDPFEYTTHCIGVVINGKVTNDQPQ